MNLAAEAWVGGLLIVCVVPFILLIFILMAIALEVRAWWRRRKR